MPDLITLATLRTRVRERIDMATSGANPTFVGNTELDEYLKRSYARLYNYLVGKYSHYFIKFATEADVVQYPSGTAGLAANVDQYAFPADFFKLVRMCIGPATPRVGSTRYELTRLHPTSWVDEMSLNPKQDTGKPTHYILHGRPDVSDIRFPAGFKLIRIPDAAYLLDIVYIPIPVDIDTGAGGDFIAGWDDFVVLDACISCRDKQRQNTRSLREERDGALGIMENAMTPMDAGSPEHVAGGSFGVLGADYDGMGEDLYD